MGLADATLFLSGILFTTSASIKTVPHLQQVIQADAAHTQFGKYTLFSAYGFAADGSMSPVAFAIMFGNENKESWGHFWRFAAKHHPSLNNPTNTLITDQDKGSIHAIKQYVPIGHHFHCSWHRKGNIMKSCGGGKKFNSGWWHFNQLVNCNTVEEIEVQCNKHLAKISTKMLRYINNLHDTAQYPVARCGMSSNIYMYGWSASSGNKSMNWANQRAQERMAIDVVNATMVLVNLENRRFTQKRDFAWNSNDILTPKGKALREKAFKDIDVNNYVVTVKTGQHFANCSVRKTGANGKIFLVKIPLAEVEGSCFGSCSCRVTQVMGVPCQHMVAVLKSGVIEGFDENNIMPVWWMMTTLKRQFPLDVTVGENMDIDWLKTREKPDSKLHHSPAMAAPNKLGRPKKGGRIKGPLEGGRKRKRA
jgi:hypothetical protein